MTMTWSGRRQSLYTAVAGVVVAVGLVVLWQSLLTSPVSCFNGKEDGAETGVDCGGTCSLLCTASTHDPVVLWARSFQTGATSYTAAAYIQNNNVGAAARQVSYSFQLFDANNILVVERDGITDLPPVQTIPVVESNIDVGNRVVARTLFAFSTTPPAVWHALPAKSYPALRVSAPTHEADYSKLSATVTNTSVRDIKNVTAIAILFDAAGVARAATKSLIPLVPANASVPQVFTWPGGVPNIVRAEITVLPAF